MNDNLFVITGGPGAGKTTLIDALERAGHARSIEAGRAIIQQQVASGGNALPWQDRAAFAEQMLRWEIRSHQNAQHQSGLIFFDRGVPDVIGYLRLCRLPVPAHMEAAAADYRYNARVFIAPPWREIFSQDTERRQDFAEAERTYAALAAAYVQCGYELIELPKAPLAERVAFVLATAAASQR